MLFWHFFWTNFLTQTSREDGQGSLSRRVGRFRHRRAQFRSGKTGGQSDANNVYAPSPFDASEHVRHLAMSVLTC